MDLQDQLFDIAYSSLTLYTINLKRISIVYLVYFREEENSVQDRAMPHQAQTLARAYVRLQTFVQNPIKPIQIVDMYEKPQ
jgi:hypothetical protein